MRNEQGNKINTKARGTQQEGTGIKQEDAEDITRGVQEASPTTPGAQRSAREIETARQRTCKILSNEGRSNPKPVSQEPPARA